MISFFHTIWDFFQFLWETISETFATLLAILNFIKSVAQSLPLSFTVTLVGVVVFSIIYKILSLGGSSD